MEPHGVEERWLPRDRAFVLQLTAGAALAPEGFRGRVEHVASGEATHFHTLDECLAFIGRVLDERRACRPADT